VVTGASSGVGRAISLNLAKLNATVCLLGRNQSALADVTKITKSTAPESKSYQIDLLQDEDIEKIKLAIEQEHGGIDILVHCAGIFEMGETESSPVSKFDRQYRTNTRAPYLLTQNLLSSIKSRRGQIVFINSSVGLNARGALGAYAASKHALKAIADSLREEVNVDGVRVMSVFLGRTATPMQANMHAAEGKTYQPDKLIQPDEVANVVTSALALPRTIEITDINIRPMEKV
jgi:short-subunit dehydrogenase